MNPLSLTFRHEFDGVSKYNDRCRDSRIRFCSGLPWNISVRSECSDRTENKKLLGIYLNCNEEDTSEIWSCEHDSKIKLINRLDDGRSIEYSVTNQYKARQRGWGEHVDLEWDKLINPDEGFIENDKIIVEATVNVKSVVGVQKYLDFDFSLPGFGADIVALLVEGKKVYADKKYLALHSDVFKAMFFGEFVEKDKEEIELTGVSHEEFVEFLYVIYPSYRQITFSSYEFVLTLADRFQVKHFHYALNAAESYLMKTTKVATMEKLIVADKFRLDSLNKYCLAGYKTLQSLKDAEARFAVLSDATKAALWHRTMQLVE